MVADGGCLQCIVSIIAMRAAHCTSAAMKLSLELLALEQFVVLARTKNFTRAGAELHLSQSALSRAIQKLEEQLGQPVFDRKPREVALTEFGELLFERAQEIIKLVESTAAELAEAGKRGRVKLGAIPTIAPYYLPGLLGGFAQKHPDISVAVQEDTTDSLIKRCTNGDIDLAIVALPIVAKGIEVEALFSEELLLVTPVGHPLAAAKKLPLTALDGIPFVTLNEAHCLSENIASFCRRKAVQPVTVERTSQLATVQELVSLDHGVSIVPEMARRVDASDRRVYRSFTGEKPSRTVALMWNAQRRRTPAARAMLEYVRSFQKR
jgi:LysR family transcriptional regulator, hydrogen peroxide-inducible genes activator